MKSATCILALLTTIGCCSFAQEQEIRGAGVDRVNVCVERANLIGSRISGTSPRCMGHTANYKQLLPESSYRQFMNLYGQEDKQNPLTEYRARVFKTYCMFENGKPLSKKDRWMCHPEACSKGREKVLTCWAGYKRWASCEAMCSDGMVTIRKYRANGDDKSNDNANWGFGPSSNVGKFKRHAGFEISRNYPLGMYNAYAVGAEIVDHVEEFCWCDVPQLCFDSHENKTLGGNGQKYPNNYNQSDPPFEDSNLMEALTWCQNEESCPGITRIKEDPRLPFSYVAKGQSALIESKPAEKASLELTYLRTCYNSFSCYNESVTPNAILEPYPFYEVIPKFAERGQAERHCRSDPTCGGLTLIDGSWHPRMGTELLFNYTTLNVQGSIVKTCPSEEAHCLSKGVANVKVDGANIFDPNQPWPYTRTSFEEAAMYCELHPKCGGITMYADAYNLKSYYARNGNLFSKGGERDLMSWRKVC